MGYRNYFYIAEKEIVDNFLKLSHEDKLKVTSELIKTEFYDNAWEEEIREYLADDRVWPYYIVKYLKATCIFECGKYFDQEPLDKMLEDSIDLSSDDNELYFIKPDALVVCAEHYKDKTYKFWETLLDMDTSEIKDRIRGHKRIVLSKEDLQNK